MCKIMSLCQVANIYSVIYKHVFVYPTRILKTTPVSECLQRPSQNACRGYPLAPTPAWMAVTVLGGATTISVLT